MKLGSICWNCVVRHICPIVNTHSPPNLGDKIKEGRPIHVNKIKPSVHKAHRCRQLTFWAWESRLNACFWHFITFRKVIGRKAPIRSPNRRSHSRIQQCLSMKLHAVADPHHIEPNGRYRSVSVSPRRALYSGKFYRLWKLLTRRYSLKAHHRHSLVHYNSSCLRYIVTNGHKLCHWG